MIFMNKQEYLNRRDPRFSIIEPPVRKTGRRSLVRHHKCWMAVDVENNSSTSRVYARDRWGARSVAPGKLRCACFYGDLQDPVTKKISHFEKTVYDEEDLTETILGFEFGSTNLCGFNVGYDYRFFPRALSNAPGRETLMSSTQFIMGFTKKGVKVWDVSTMLGGHRSLDDWGKDLGCATVKNFDHSASKLTDLVRHCQLDTKLTHEIVSVKMRELSEITNIPFAMTAPRTSYLFFIRNHLPYRASQMSIAKESQMERKAYFGGWTAIYARNPKKPLVMSYHDIHQAYVSAMAYEKFPIPNGAGSFRREIQHADSEWEDALYSDELGVFSVNVITPDDIFVPILPIREKDSKKLFFPKGRISGVYTTPDLKRAIETGYEVDSCNYFCVYHHNDTIFQEFALFCHSQRAKYKAEGNIGVSNLYKLLGNSLYGKWLQTTPSISRRVIPRDKDAMDFIEKHGIEVGFGPGECQFIGTEDNPWISINESEDEIASSHYFPIWGAFITSYVRNKLYSGIERINATDFKVNYTDTDSIISGLPGQDLDESGRLEINRALGDLLGGDLGKFGEEPTDGSFLNPMCLIASKNYEITKPDGTIERTSKGIPRRAEEYLDTNLTCEEQNKTRSFRYEAPLSVVSVSTRKNCPVTFDCLGRWVNMEKQINLYGDSKRVWLTEGEDQDWSEPIEKNMW